MIPSWGTRFHTLQLRVHRSQLKILRATTKRPLMLQVKIGKKKKKEPTWHTKTWCSQINKLIIIIIIKLGSAQLCPGPTESVSGGLREVRELAF